MTYQKNSITVLVFILLVLLVSACGGSEELVEAVAVDELTVIFESESCNYDGPAVIQAGEVKLIYDNRSENVLIDGTFLIPEGHTWQEFVEILSLKDTNNWMPDWAVFQDGNLMIEDPRAKVYDLQPGLYALTCGEIYDTGGWKNYPAAPLEVR